MGINTLAYHGLDITDEEKKVHDVVNSWSTFLLLSSTRCLMKKLENRFVPLTFGPMTLNLYDKAPNVVMSY
jgi:hypothetical protein